METYQIVLCCLLLTYLFSVALMPIVTYKLGVMADDEQWVTCNYKEIKEIAWIPVANTAFFCLALIGISGYFLIWLGKQFKG